MNNISITKAVCTINVPFHGAELYIVNYNGEPFTPMKPIVEGMGMIWAAQFVKLKQRFISTISEIEMVADDGKSRKMVCLPLRKLAGWLATISPNKVKPEIRDKVIQYQEECDDVLYEYWTTGEVKAKPRKQVKQIAGCITAEQQEAIKQLVLTRGKSVPHEHQGKATITLWSALKSHFGCSYKEIAEEKFTEALSLAARIPIEGEFIGKAPLQNNLPAICGRIVLDYENGSVTRTEVVPANYFIGDIETLMEYLERRGVVVLADEAERRNFVKENLMRLIN